jgi:16S rRNA (cytosine1402-N4)-methyltransferase
MLLDLGVNMEHFKDGTRGFSFHTDAPLDMRFSQTNPTTAKDILAQYPAEKLEKILMLYGDYSPKSAAYLATGIIEARKKCPLETTVQLRNLLHTLHCNKKSIAVIFQVLRIETNQELKQLEIFLQKFGLFLSLGGRCSIITYHSIEDRMTKNAFKSLVESGDFQLVHKKVIQPHYTQVQQNRAARSAKLRTLERIR